MSANVASLPGVLAIALIGIKLTSLLHKLLYGNMCRFCQTLSPMRCSRRRNCMNISGYRHTDP